MVIEKKPKLENPVKLLKQDKDLQKLVSLYSKGNIMTQE